MLIFPVNIFIVKSAHGIMWKMQSGQFNDWPSGCRILNDVMVFIS